ncbi:MAG TPA: PAS domain S-box protein, partial [Candidatus Thermoplasmatota archaeon]|nr:PAS domain S-box protein [Candidatus Thermoplasmatota archaeon]
MNNKNNESEQAATLRKKAEEIALKKAVQSSEKLDALSPEEIRQTLHELQVHQIELEMQNEELRRVQANLDEAMERYFDLYNLAPVGYFTINEKGFIIEANLTFASLLGVEKNTLIKKPFTQFILPDDQDVFYNHHKQISKTVTDASQACELRMVKKDGTKFWVHLESTTVLDSDGEQVYRVVMSDITERKKADEILSQSEEKFRKEFSTLFDDAPVGIALVDKNGIIQEVNNNLLRLLSIRKEELIGSSFVELAPTFGLDITENITDFKNRLIEAPSNKEITFLNKNNSKTTITVQSSTIKSGDEILGILYILNDITDRKKAVEQLKNSEERYRNLIELAPDSIVTLNLKGYFTSCNSAATRIFRYSKDDLIGKHFSKIGVLHVKDVPKYLKVFVSLLQGKSSGIYELTINDKDGTSRIAETHIGLIKENNRISGICAITRDITERKKIEREIIESEEKLKQILDSSPDAITVTDLKGNIIECNQTASKMYGSPKAELIGKNALQFFSPKDRKKAKDNLMKTLEVGFIKNVEYILQTKGGREFPAELSANLIRDASGNPQSFVSIVRDITERKKAEGALKESQEKYRLIAENTNDLIIITNVDKTFRYVSPSIKSLGYTPEELVGQDSFILLHPEDNISITSMLKQLIIGRYKPGTNSRFEYRLRDKSGMYHLYET